MITITKTATLLSLIDETPRNAGELAEMMNQLLIEQNRQNDGLVTHKIVGAMLSSLVGHHRVLFNEPAPGQPRGRYYYIPADGVPSYRLVPTPDPLSPIVNGWIASARAVREGFRNLGWTLA